MFAAAALLALLFVQQQQLIALPQSGRIASAVPDALHGPWFAVVTWLIAAFAGRYTRGASTLWITALLGALLAVGTEVLQGLTGGDAELGDVVCDLLGMGAALCVRAARADLMRPRPAIAVAVLLLVVSQWPLVHAQLVDRYRNTLAPELLGFDSVFANDLVTSNSAVAFVAPPAAWPIGHRVLRIALADETYPGIHLDDPIADWRSYTALAVDVYVDGTQPLPVTISVRIDNAPVDHVYRTFGCAPGPCAIVWPLAGLFDPDVARVNAVVIYSARDSAGRVVYLGRVALER
jgi:hypothetical protein